MTAIFFIVFGAEEHFLFWFNYRFAKTPLLALNGTELAFSAVTGAANASNYGTSHPDAAANEVGYKDFPSTEK